MEGGGQVEPTSGRDHGNLSRLRSSSLEHREKEIREKGSEILREQLDAAKKVAISTVCWHKVTVLALPMHIALLVKRGLFSKTSQELKLKDKECERLSQVRNQLEQELEELTASLFEVSSNHCLL